MKPNVKGISFITRRALEKTYAKCVEEETEERFTSIVQSVVGRSAAEKWNKSVATASKFTDEAFPVTDAIYWADHRYEAKTRIAKNSSKASWRRAADKYPYHSLWGPSGVIPNDIAQGDLGNCWIINSFSALAEYPDRIHNIFHNTEKSEDGYYALNMYAIGVPYTIIIDDYLPFRQNGDHLFANVGYDQALWGPLAEKAVAKYVGNYWHSDWGRNFDAISFMTGGPSYYLSHWKRGQ